MYPFSVFFFEFMFQAHDLHGQLEFEPEFSVIQVHRKEFFELVDAII